MASCALNIPFEGIKLLNKATAIIPPGPVADSMLTFMFQNGDTSKD